MEFAEKLLPPIYVCIFIVIVESYKKIESYPKAKNILSKRKSEDLNKHIEMKQDMEIKMIIITTQTTKFIHVKI